MVDKFPAIAAEATPEFQTQEFSNCCRVWSVSRLVQISKSLPTLRLPIAGLYLGDETDGPLTLRQLAGQYECISRADLKYPIILSADGEIMDGRHRVVKAIVTGKKVILAKRFEETPEPCRIIECTCTNGRYQTSPADRI